MSPKEAGPSTVLTAWTGTLLRAVEARELDIGGALADAAIGDGALADPDRRIPMSSSTRLWGSVVEVTGDDAFGIEVSRHVRPTTFHALGHAFLSSPTLEAALQRTARYSRVTADIAVGSCRWEGSDFLLVIGWREGAARPAYEAVDAALASIVRGARSLLGREVSPTRVELERPPPVNVGRFETFYRCPIRFGASENVLAFDRADTQRPVPGGNDRLASLNEQALSEYLRSLEPDTVAGRVREVLADTLDAGDPDIVAVATELAMSPRTLQRRLGNEGTSFRSVLADTRRQLADALLAAGDVSVTEIAMRLGFSERCLFSCLSPVDRPLAIG